LFAISYPANWKPMNDAASKTVTFADPRAVTADSKGQGRLSYGVVVSLFIPQSGPVDLERDTAAFLNSVLAGSPDLRRLSEPQPARAAGQQALVTQLQGPSSFAGDSENDRVITIARPEGLLYLIFVTPRSELQAVQGTLDAMLGSLRFH
jgi:hypothetical protein